MDKHIELIGHSTHAAPPEDLGSSAANWTAALNETPTPTCWRQPSSCPSCRQHSPAMFQCTRAIAGTPRKAQRRGWHLGLNPVQLQLQQHLMCCLHVCLLCCCLLCCWARHAATAAAATPSTQVQSTSARTALLQGPTPPTKNHT